MTDPVAAGIPGRRTFNHHPRKRPYPRSTTKVDPCFSLRVPNPSIATTNANRSSVIPEPENRTPTAGEHLAGTRNACPCRRPRCDQTPHARAAPLRPPSVLSPRNHAENPRCAEAHLGYDVRDPIRLHTGWGLVGRRRDTRHSGQRCPGAGRSPGGRGHTGLTRYPNRLKARRLERCPECLPLRLGRSPKKRSQRCNGCGDRRRQQRSQTRALGHPETPARFYRPSARTSSQATRST